jgi:hypothetical protein
LYSGVFHARTRLHAASSRASSACFRSAAPVLGCSPPSRERRRSACPLLGLAPGGPGWRWPVGGSEWLCVAQAPSGWLSTPSLVESRGHGLASSPRQLTLITLPIPIP